tara:strand:+ start:6560 stop:6850 length:291 start_codon:yes stop_codon:yes gene_type:complete
LLGVKILSANCFKTWYNLINTKEDTMGCDWTQTMRESISDPMTESIKPVTPKTVTVQRKSADTNRKERLARLCAVCDQMESLAAEARRLIQDMEKH